MTGFARHRARTEMPDPIGHADLLRFRDQYAADLHRRFGHDTLSIADPHLLPLPNGPHKVRSLSLLEPRDELLLRTAAGVVVAETAGMVDRDRVFSFETSKRSSTWELKGKGINWNGLNRKALTLMRTAQPEVVLQRDVKSYYASCDGDLVGSWMKHALSLPESLVRCATERLDKWQREGFPGLPIGPEFSAIIGTAFLFGVDDVLRDHAAVVHHLRVTDDFYIALDDSGRADEVDEALRSALALRGLLLNESKSEELTLEEAIERFEQREIEYCKAELDADPDDADEVTVEMLVGMSADPAADMKLSSFVLGVARRRKLTAAIPAILAVPAFLELWPAICGDVLVCRPGAAIPYVDDLMRYLDEPYSDRTAARNLQLIRALPGTGLGAVEGEVLKTLALDAARPVPLRAWALYRASSTPVMSVSDRADLALDASTDSFLQRASIISLRGDDSAEKARLLGDSRITGGHLRYAGAWATAA